MTNHWIDLKNSDCILIMGSNAAENHPISMKYVTEAQSRGGKLISVDPRFTRTSAKADIYAPLRSGTDIAFLGGMIKYIIDNKLYNEEDVVAYSDAAFLVGDGFDFKDGLFSGYDTGKRAYDASKWTYQLDANGVPKKDLTLQDKRCVFQLLKAHYARYTPDLVSKITGTPEKDLLEVYKAYAATGAKGKAGTIMYAMGWTQHTVGVQNIRAMSIIQTLLANMGVAGGGVNALRGESNVQGSTDHGLLFHILPGYIATPATNWPKLEDYLKRRPKSSDPLSANWWQNEPKYMVSLLKAYFGDAATADNEFGYPWMPKLDAGKAYSWLDLFDVMYNGDIKGFFAWGMNPACSGANANKTRAAMKNLDWMVNVNLFDNETGSFWRGPGMDPAKIKTEVFMLPACVSVEKEGSITNSGRWMQWRYRGPKPLGESRPDGDIILALGNKLKELYKKEGGAFPDPILSLKWDYADSHGEFDPHKVAKTINGYFLEDVTIDGTVYKKGTLVPTFGFLQVNGSTSSGCWVYCRQLHRKGQHGRPPQHAGCAERHRALPRVRLGLAGQPAHHLQPRLGRSPGPTPRPEGLGDQVGRQQMGGRCPRRAVAPPGKPAIPQPQGPLAIHHDPPRLCHDFRGGLEGRPLPGTLRAARVPRGEELHECPAGQPHGAGVGRQGRRFRDLRPALSLRGHHLPGERALADRPHDPLPALADGDAAPDVCGDERGAGGPQADQERRACEGRHGAGPGRVHRHRDQAVQAVQIGRHRGARGRFPLALRLALAGERERGECQPADSLHRGPQHPHSRIQGLHGQHREDMIEGR